MAIPYQPQSLSAQQADGNILLTWTGSLGATSYIIQRATDGVNFTTLGTSTSVQYLDALPGIGIQYYYQVAGVSGSDVSVYSSVATMVAALPGEMSLLELRLSAQETADRVESDFVTNSEWNRFARLALYELYDLLIGSYEAYKITDPAYINTNGTTLQYALPNGVNNYLGGVFDGTSGTPSQRFYKLYGLDLGVNTSNNAWVTLHSFNFIDRNAYVYPNSTSTIYGVYNMRYSITGDNLMIIPTPAGNQQLRMWYAPVLPGLLADTDLTNIGYTGWLRYPIARMAKYALDKEQGSADTSKLDAELIFLKTRIEQMAQNRDQGQPSTISNTRRDPVYGGGFSNDGGANGGWAVFLFPVLPGNDIGNRLLVDTVLFAKFSLAHAAMVIFSAYFLYLFSRKLGGGILFSRIRNGFAESKIGATFSHFISHIFKTIPKKQVIRPNT